MSPIQPKLLPDFFQPRLTEYFEVTEVKRYPDPPPQPTQDSVIFVFYLANGRREVFEFDNPPYRTRLSDHWRLLAQHRIGQRPQLRILEIDGPSYSWGYIGWAKYFNVPTSGIPAFFHLSNDKATLPATWTQDVDAFLEAI
ncbi:hypothetical protein PQX77_007169 [Marasmius sp. AFHP31]|nr:hypothetical protein PQX77_007169 [Marasmius sp. AFHP31]